MPNNAQTTAQLHSSHMLVWRRQWHPTPALAWKIPWTEEPGRLQSMGSQRVGHDWATSLSLSCIGEGNGNPLQCSCLENPKDGGAWWAAVYGVAQSWTWLMWLSSLAAYASKVMLKFSKSGFNSTWTVNKMFKLVLEKTEEPEIKLPISAGSMKKQESSRKTSISALLTMPKPLTVWLTTNCEKFLQRWEYQTTWPASWEICMQVRKQQLELDMEQQTGFQIGKRSMSRLYIVTLLI